MTRAKPFVLAVTTPEREQVVLAAKLKHLSVREYLVRAINAQLRKDGVDSVLLREWGDS